MEYRLRSFYFIRLDALNFKPSRSQRKVIYRWSRFIMYGNVPESDRMLSEDESQEAATVPGCLAPTLHALEHRPNRPRKAHKFEVFLESPSYTAEKYQLYEAYQAQVHGDTLNLPYLFYRFLVESPLLVGNPLSAQDHSEPTPPASSQTAAIPYPAPAPAHLPRQYGSYHQLYRLDGRLIGMSVLDILPGSVSSVYFVYDRRWVKYSLGKLSIMYEAALVQEMHQAGLPNMEHLHLGLFRSINLFPSAAYNRTLFRSEGFYIHSNPKMKYKGEYSPTYLLDPEELSWHPVPECLPLLEQYRYACFSHPEHSLAGPDDPGELPISTPSDESLEEIRFAKLTDGEAEVIPIKSSEAWADAIFLRPTFAATIQDLGVELAKELVFH
ncbi:hypothetical protein GLOTRDRAFT_125034 [Gloeophyllum trabeum ATCC 11539]|uniref:N-end rule aminoacyl transferase C-terminal domain-containing protein n=1 Tax=Gloeophyllum trabeum (strain ATCC 11539 / FP-39264 / Madison 617) TaxID=670483 RepID=S7QPL8_GLOTA|nr:uncharacterized protein GLOTRDRAFT_125034 [Gloeophyllum trabeum ATCC 11539]EPQ61312.1 hypothetical protein GLOTRDRAFT_125034 [Gloeophyllum trabeum ATCC 11539]